ncbi:MAG: hypothetical protein OEV39_09685 [Gammaproteobacteria bacterium]|nr:hypothetical protein [Gammaproteobacteria bacterium]MDH5176481.1 hypothetical protein [Gammaproteobacteria bacterium]
MKFLKSTLVTGLLVLVPLLLLWLALGEIAGLLMAMVDPILLVIPSKLYSGVFAPGVLAAVVLLATAFIVGLVSRSRGITRMGAGLERSVLAKMPVYGMFKSLSESFLDARSSNFRPALVLADDGSATPCYIVEECPDDSAAVLLPWSPTSFAGSVRIVPRSRLRVLGCSLQEFSRALGLMGVGIGSCIGKELRDEAPIDAPARL